MVRVSIKRQLIISVVIGLLLPVAILSAWTFATRELSIHDRLEYLSEQYSDLIEPVMTQAIWGVDEQAARRVMKTLMRNSTIARISVKDGDMVPWVDSGPLPSGRASDFVVTRALRLDGQLIGYLVLELSGGGISSEISSNFFKLLAVVVFQALISIAPVLWIMNRRVLTPLRVLGQEAIRLGNHDLSRPIAAFRGDEIGALAAQFEQARQQLMTAFSSLAASQRALELELAGRREAQLALEQMAEHLEASVIDRTKELSEANDRLTDTVLQLNSAKDEIVRSEKLAALGGMVAGIAHELNTPIGNGLLTATSVIDLTNQFQLQLTEGPIRRALLNEYMTNVAKGCEIAQMSLQRAAELISAFKQVAADQTSSARRNFILNTLVDEIVLMMGPSFKKTPFTIDSKVADDILLDSYPGELGQVLINLFQNSLLHGFEGRNRGSVHISAQLASDQYVRLIFADDGQGIPAENLDRIFEPFFTTKMGRGGTGLGLHLVYNLVTNVLGGTITIHSGREKGVEVVIDFPLIAPVHPERTFSAARH